MTKENKEIDNIELFDEQQKKIFDEKTILKEEKEEDEESFTFNELPDNQEYKVKFSEDEDVEVKTFKDAEGNETKIKIMKMPLEIESARILLPRIKDVDGNIIPPLETISKKNNRKLKYYVSKVEILYKDSNYKSLVPSIRWWVNGSQVTPSFKTEFVENVDLKYITDITKLYWKFCDAYGYDKTKKDETKILSQKQFINELVGKKAIIKELTTFYQDQWRFKLAIDSFVKEEK